MKCPICGKKISKKDIFCAKCGYSFLEDGDKYRRSFANMAGNNADNDVDNGSNNNEVDNGVNNDFINNANNDNTPASDNMGNFDPYSGFPGNNAGPMNQDIYANNKPSSKKKFIIIGAAAAVVLALAAVLLVVFVILPSQVKGDYYLMSYISDSGDDVAADLCCANKDFPVKFSVSDSKSGTIIGMSGDEFSTVSFDSSKHTGTIHYSSGGSDGNIEITIENDTAMIRDNEKNATMSFKKFKDNKVALPSNYTVSYAGINGTYNHLETLVCSGNTIPEKISFTDDGKGVITDSKGDNYATIDLDRSTMTGSMSYSSGGDKHNSFLAVGSGACTIYDIDNNAVISFIKPESVDFEKVAANDYKLISFNNMTEGNYMQYCIQNKISIPALLELNADGTFTITNANDSSYASIKINKSSLKGDMTLSDNKKIYSVITAYKDNALTIYSPENNSVYVYKKGSSVDWDACAGKYVLTADRYDSSNEDYIKHCVFNEWKISSELDLKNNCTGTILYGDGNSYASFEFNKTTWRGVITYTESDAEHDIYITNHNGVFRIYDPDYKDMMEYTLPGNTNWESVSGDYVLADSASYIIDDFIKYQTVNNFKIPGKLLLNSDCTGTLLYNDGDSYGEIKFDKDNRTGTLTYTKTGNEMETYIVYREGYFTVFDKDSKRYYSYIKSSGIDIKSAARDYALSEMSTKDEPDYIEFQTKNKYKITGKLTLNNDYTGKIFFSDDALYADIKFDKDLMTGEITYAVNNKTNPVFITYHDGIFRIYDTGNHTFYGFTDPSSIKMSEIAGDYMLVSSSEPDTDDLTLSWTVNSKMLPSNLVLKDNCTGTITNRDDGSTFATFSFDQDTHYGSIKYNLTGKTQDIYVAINKDNIGIYDSTFHSTYIYRRNTKLDLSRDEGTYVLTESVSGDEEDYIEYSVNNSYKIPVALEIAEDGSGALKYSDGSTFAEFTLDEDSCDGTITFVNSGESKDVYVTSWNDKIGVYCGEFTICFIYKSKSDIALDDAVGDGTISAMSAKGQKDYIAYLKKDKKNKIPTYVTINKDYKGEILDADKKTYATFTISEDMSGKLTFASDKKELDAFYKLDGSNLVIYDISNARTITCKIGS